MHVQAKNVIKDYVERNKLYEPGYGNVTESMKRRLHALVGDHYWKKANDYFIHFIQQKRRQQIAADAAAATTGAAATGDGSSGVDRIAAIHVVTPDTTPVASRAGCDVRTGSTDCSRRYTVSSGSSAHQQGKQQVQQQKAKKPIVQKQKQNQHRMKKKAKQQQQKQQQHDQKRIQELEQQLLLQKQNKKNKDCDYDTNISCCIVCMDQPRTHIFVPCGHLCTCQSCSTYMKSMSSPCGGHRYDRLGRILNPLLCPICKQKSQQIIQLFHP